MNLNEMFTTEGLRILEEELSKGVDDWQDVLRECPSDKVVAERLAVIKKLHEAIKEQLTTTTTELIEEYVPGYDHTFIMEATYVNGDMISVECVGWYCGEPDARYTKLYSDRNMKATY